MEKSVLTGRHKSGSRMLALDILRGLTVAGMILVNNPGSWDHVYAPLRHAQWHGLTPTDLVFPFFMFIMGVSTAFSLRHHDFRTTGNLVLKIFKRTIIIFALGLLLDRVAALAWGGMSAGSSQSWFTAAINAAFNLDTIRIPGVLQRLALCYCFAALIGICFGRRVIKWIVTSLLVGYGILLLACHGLDFDPANIIGIVDRSLLGENHIYHESVGGISMAFDPEGILSTFPSIAHCLIGFLSGRMLLDTRSHGRRVLNLFISGTLLMFFGFLLSYLVPVNKAIWSPTFVLTTCGMASSLFALLIWWVDIRGHNRWCRFLEVFGINPLFLYVVSCVLAVVIAISVDRMPYEVLYSITGCGELASLLCGLLFVGLNWLIGYPLYRWRVIIKI